jgi:hypothetical protein
MLRTLGIDIARSGRPVLERLALVPRNPDEAVLILEAIPDGISTAILEEVGGVVDVVVVLVQVAVVLVEEATQSYDESVGLRVF